MVHRREVGGAEIVLGNQGALWNAAMTWWDHGTGSVWSQPIGEAVAGPLRGTRLQPLGATVATWSSWRARHPGTLALDAPGGTGGFALEDMVVVVDLGTDSAAYRVPDLRTAGVVNDMVGGQEIAVVVAPGDPDAWRVFSRRVGDVVVDLALEGDALVDAVTGTRFDPLRGAALGGPLAGDAMGVMPSSTSFRSDYLVFFPDGRVWAPTG